MPKTLFRSATDTLLFLFLRNRGSSYRKKRIQRSKEHHERLAELDIVLDQALSDSLRPSSPLPPRPLFGSPSPPPPPPHTSRAARRLDITMESQPTADFAARARSPSRERAASPVAEEAPSRSASPVICCSQLRQQQSAKKLSDVQSTRKPNHDTQHRLAPRARISISPSRTWNRIAPVRPSHCRPRFSGRDSCMCTRTTRAGFRCVTMQRAFHQTTHMISICALVSETSYGQTVLGFTSNGCRQRSLRVARALCRTWSDHKPLACSPGPQDYRPHLH
jgi:hypothetical protein